MTKLIPRYLQIADVLEQHMAGLAPNSLLPTEDQLAKRFGVSRVTIRRALGLLERSGRVSRRRGRGTVVSPRKLTRRLVPDLMIEHDFRNQGIKLQTRVIQYEPRISPPDDIRERLKLRYGESVGFLTMLRLVDDQIICHDQRYLPPKIAAVFNPAFVQSHPVSELLQDLAGARVALSDLETEILPCSHDIAKALGITPGVLIVLNTFTAYLADGLALETGSMAYRIDRVKFKIVQAETPVTLSEQVYQGRSGSQGSEAEWK